MLPRGHHLDIRNISTHLLLSQEVRVSFDQEQILDQCNEAQGHEQGGVTLVSLPQHLLSPPGDTDSCSSPLGLIRPIVLLRSVVLKAWRYTVCAPDRLELHVAGPVSRISQVSFAT